MSSWEVTLRVYASIIDRLTDEISRIYSARPEPEIYTLWLRFGPIEEQPGYAGKTSAAASAALRSTQEDAMANQTRELTDTQQFSIFLDGMTDKKGKKVTGIDVEVVSDDDSVASVEEVQADKEWKVTAGDPGTTTVTLRGTNRSGTPFMSAFAVIVNPGDVDVLDVRLGDNEEQPAPAPAPAPAPEPAPAPAPAGSDGGAGDTTGGVTGGGIPTGGTDTGGSAAPTDGGGTAAPAPAPAPAPVDAGATGGSGGVQIDPATGAPVTPTNPGA